MHDDNQHPARGDFEAQLLKLYEEAGTDEPNLRFEDSAYIDPLIQSAWWGFKTAHDDKYGQCLALSRDVSIARRQKSQYFRAVKWFLANTNIDPKNVPAPVYHTLVHVVTTLAEKAKRAAAEVANG